MFNIRILGNKRPHIYLYPRAPSSLCTDLHRTPINALADPGVGALPQDCEKMLVKSVCMLEKMPISL